MRDCHPGPPALYFSITWPDSRRDTSFFVGALFGPRPRRIEAASSGKASAKGFAFDICSLVSSGLSETASQSLLLYPFPGLKVLAIEKAPFLAVRAAHADDADAFAAEHDKHDHHNAAGETT